MEERIFETILDGGIAAALAALMFFFYRKDSNEWTSRWERAANDEKSKAGEWIQVVKENTAAITTLKDELRKR